MRYVRPCADARSTRLLLIANLVAVLIGSVSGPALADERTINAMGHGVESCQAWLEARKDGYSAGYGDWLLGYLTGVNLWGPTNGRDLLRNQKAQEMIEWVDKYCSVFPNELIESAARQLILDLGRRAKEFDTSSRRFQ
jgi:hypothetical protein